MGKAADDGERRLNDREGKEREAEGPPGDSPVSHMYLNLLISGSALPVEN